jgi:hypothetical protein
MTHGALLVTWILLVSMQTLRCTGDVCEIVPQHSVSQKPLTRFDSRLVCEDYRQALEAQTPPVVHSQGRPDVTIRKQMTFACRIGD